MYGKLKCDFYTLFCQCCISRILTETLWRIIVKFTIRNLDRFQIYQKSNNKSIYIRVSYAVAKRKPEKIMTLQFSIFSWLSFRNCISCLHNCDGHSLFHSFTRSSNVYISIYIPFIKEITTFPRHKSRISCLFVSFQNCRFSTQKVCLKMSLVYLGDS